MKIFNIPLFICLFSISACSHQPLNTKLSNDWSPLKKRSQKALVRKQTKSHKEYDGLHLTYEAALTFLNSAIQTNNLKISSQFRNWTPSKAQEQKDQKWTDLAKTSEFFLTFYTPQTKRNKLNQKAAAWKAVLRINGQEFEGTIKLRENLSHHNKAFYPEIDPWSTPYLVTFPVATQKLESSKFNVVLLAPEGMATFKY